jgi:hypothetical protein
MQLGIKVKDKITGFEGIVTGFVTYLSGCNQSLVVPPVDKDGKVVEGVWFDVQRLDRIDQSVVVLNNRETPGNDIPPARRL